MLTAKQKTAVSRILSHKYTLLYGGARSGKTHGTIDCILYLAMKYPLSRHIVARRYLVDVKASVWNDTLQKVLRLHGLRWGKQYHANNSELKVTLANGSTISCVGLDDKDRVGKILGQEFSTIYVNESHDVDYITVETIMTRLSQNIGCRNRFICDLNPTTKAHWTHKLFIEGINPKAGEPIPNPKDYAFLQMNPLDNAANLPADYIQTKLETLRGQERARFLLGEYSTTDDLLVFRPPHLHEWSDFTAWVGNGSDVRLIAGLDLGYDDADAFAVLAYRDGQRGAWLLYEHKARKQTITDLGNAIKRGVEWIGNNVNLRSIACPIYTDTGGGGKKSAYELSQVFNIDIYPAVKRDKALGIDFLQDWVNSGELMMLKGSTFVEECGKIVWERGDNGEIVREIDHRSYHPDMMDGVLYAMRQLMGFDNTVYRREEPAELESGEDVHDRLLNQAVERASNSDGRFF